MTRVEVEGPRENVPVPRPGLLAKRDTRESSPCNRACHRASGELAGEIRSSFPGRVIPPMPVDYSYPTPKAIWRPVKPKGAGDRCGFPERDSVCIKAAVCNHNGQLS